MLKTNFLKLIVKLAQVVLITCTVLLLRPQNNHLLLSQFALFTIILTVD